jgi:hypothetical protein
MLNFTAIPGENWSVFCFLASPILNELSLAASAVQL